MSVRRPWRAPAPRAALLSDIEKLVSEIEARLALPRQPATGEEFSDEALALVAHRVYQSRRRRTRYLAPGLFGEPAWDILLDLFCARVHGKKARTTSVCLAARTPASTGLRWLGVLEEQGLIHRGGESDDRRARWVSLTDHGYRAMKQYLSEGMRANELPAGNYMSPRR